MQFYVRVPRKQRRPLGLGLLHTIFTEDALTGSDHGFYGVCAKSLRYRN
jgi:hypothetical protein